MTDNFFKIIPTIMLLMTTIALSDDVLAVEKISKVDKMTLAAAKEAVKGILKDPASAQFKDITSNVDGDICGEYNAKNSYGGYGQPEYFMYVKKTKELLNIKVMQLENEYKKSSEVALMTLSNELQESAGKKLKMALDIKLQIAGCERQ